MLSLLRTAALGFALVLAMPLAYADVTADAEIDRLMAIFKVREASELAVSSTLDDPGFRNLQAEQQACVRGVFSLDALLGEMRIHYHELFADSRIRAETLAFFQASAGKKILELQFSGKGDSSIDWEASFTPTELREFDAFFASPAGQLFLNIGKKLASLQEASINRLVASAVANCGPPRRN
jgi:hypothetical protein